MNSVEWASFRDTIVSLIKVGKDLSELRGENKALREEVDFLRGLLRIQGRIGKVENWQTGVS